MTTFCTGRGSFYNSANYFSRLAEAARLVVYCIPAILITTSL